MIDIKCSNCGNDFPKKESHVKYFLKENPNWNFFCKKECYKSFKTKPKKIKAPIIKCCDICNENFEIVSGSHGGQNRMFCYECFPDGLNKRERSDLRKSLYRKKANDEKMTIGCKLCGYNKTGYALDWHHHNDDKDFEPSNLLNRSWNAYQEEIKKCVLLCSNCHREVHYGIAKL